MKFIAPKYSVGTFSSCTKLSTLSAQTKHVNCNDQITCQSLIAQKQTLQLVCSPGLIGLNPLPCRQDCEFPDRKPPQHFVRIALSGGISIIIM